MQAGEKRWGTDESSFNAIFASQSFEQLRAVFDAYQRVSGRDIEQVVKSEMSGNLVLGMVAISKWMLLVVYLGSGVTCWVIYYYWFCLCIVL